MHCGVVFDATGGMSDAKLEGGAADGFTIIVVAEVSIGAGECLEQVQVQRGGMLREGSWEWPQQGCRTRRAVTRDVQGRLPDVVHQLIAVLPVLSSALHPSLSSSSRMYAFSAWHYVINTCYNHSLRLGLITLYSTVRLFLTTRFSLGTWLSVLSSPLLVTWKTNLARSTLDYPCKTWVLEY